MYKKCSKCEKVHTTSRGVTFFLGVVPVTTVIVMAYFTGTSIPDLIRGAVGIL